MKRLMWIGLAGFVLCGAVQAQPAAQTVGRDADFRRIVQSAKDKVFPAVVFIKVLQETHEMGKKTTREALGSGVIISPGGEVVSNWHVVDKAVEIRCLLSSGEHFQATLVGSDKDMDLALLQLKLPEAHAPLPYAEFGDSSVLKEGDFVMAMGAPWGLNRSVSIGIISCARRYLPKSSEYSHWLQTDAAINPGNSGGPMVDTRGKIVGINTRGGGDLGFAVPSENCQIVIDQLRQFKNVNWSWMGIQLQPLKDFRKNIYFEGDEGVIVAETEPASPARRSGLQVRDRLLSVNGQPTTAVWEENLPAVRRLLGMLPKGKPARLLIDRGGKELTIEITPREKGEVEGEELDCPRWDLTVKAINQFDNEDLYFYKKKGVFIYGIKRPGNAASSGLQKKDILLRIDKKKVETLADVKQIHAEALDNINQQHRIVLTVLRNGLLRQVVLDFSRDYEKE
jgi:serine protease Do